MNSFEKWSASIPYPLDEHETRLARVAWYAALEAAIGLIHKPYSHGLGWEAAQEALKEVIVSERRNAQEEP